MEMYVTPLGLPTKSLLPFMGSYVYPHFKLYSSKTTTIHQRSPREAKIHTKIATTKNCVCQFDNYKNSDTLQEEHLFLTDP